MALTVHRIKLDDVTHDGQHVFLCCDNHPELIWHCKAVAVSRDSNGVPRYNQLRNIFFAGALRDDGTADDWIEATSRYISECNCAGSLLRLMEPID